MSSLEGVAVSLRDLVEKPRAVFVKPVRSVDDPDIYSLLEQFTDRFSHSVACVDRFIASNAKRVADFNVIGVEARVVAVVSYTFEGFHRELIDRMCDAKVVRCLVVVCDSDCDVQYPFDPDLEQVVAFGYERLPIGDMVDDQAVVRLSVDNDVGVNAAEALIVAAVEAGMEKIKEMVRAELGRTINVSSR